VGTDAEISRAQQIQGWMTDGELRWLGEWARQCPSIVEVGAWKGRSTRALGDNTLGRVWSVDTWEGSPSERSDNHAEAVTLGADGLYGIYSSNLRDLIELGRVVPLRMRSVAAARHLLRADGPVLDFVFLDADHVYPSVAQDIRAWMPLVRSGGILAGHDYYYPDVNRAVREQVFGIQVVESIWYQVRP
jgi:hypothetical protein